MQRVHGALRLLRARRGRPAGRASAGRSGVPRRRPRAASCASTSDRVDVGRVAIGQGGLLATPLQMAMVAVGGRQRRQADEADAHRPHRRPRRAHGRGHRARARCREVMKASTAREVGDMMANVVRRAPAPRPRSRASRSPARPAPRRSTSRAASTSRGSSASRRASNPKIAIAVTIERSQRARAARSPRRSPSRSSRSCCG